jgi:transcriptional regulator with XRE-family HTH domain
MEVRGLRAKHWQQLETGRPITVETLLRICQALDVTLAFLVDNLDEGIYKELPLPVLKKRGRTSRKRRPRSDESPPEVWHFDLPLAESYNLLVVFLMESP